MANTNTKDITEMLRDAYEPELIEDLQDKVQSYTPYVTNIPAEGKQVEFNSIGSVEAGFRVGKWDKKVDQEFLYGRRSMRPVSLALSVKYAKDDMTLKGAFAAGPADFIRQMGYAFNRGIDAVILGVVLKLMKKTASDVGRPYWTIAPSTDLAVPASFYNGAAIGGIVGTAYGGDTLTTPETLDLKALLNDGEYLETSNTSAVATDLNMEVTGVIPAGYTAKGAFVLSGMTVEKVLALREALESRNAIEPGEIINLAITPAMKYELIRDERLWNNQTGFQTLRNGLFSELLGVRFLVTNKVPIVNVGTSSAPVWQFACPAWKSSEVVMGMWDDLEFEITKPEDHWGKYRIAAQCALGCARRRKESVMLIMCDAGLPAYSETASTLVKHTVAANE